MIQLKLFGLLRLQSGVKELAVEASTVRQAQQALLANSSLTEKDVTGCVVFINGKPGTKRSKLQDGDQVIFMSPVAGG